MKALLYPPTIRLKRITVNALLTVLLSLFVLSNSLAERTYGPVQPRDYLGKIVSASYPNSSLATHQIMVAILRANPDAFRGGNIHFLKQKVVLTLPDEDVIATIPADQATALVNEHLAYFKRGRTGNFIHQPLPKTESIANAPVPEPEPALEPKPVKNEPEAAPGEIQAQAKQQETEIKTNTKKLDSLKEINAKQNAILNSLDEQIRRLEEQLKKDSEQAKAKELKELEATTKSVMEKEAVASAEDSFAEKTISSLESRLGGGSEKQTPEAELAPETTSEAKTSEIIPPSPVETKQAQETETTSTEKAEPATISKKVTEPVVTQEKEEPTPVPTTLEEAPATVTEETTKSQTPDTAIKVAEVDTPKSTSPAIEVAAVDVPKPASPVIESSNTSGDSGSTFNQLTSALKNNKLPVLLSVFILSLFALSYFLLRSKSDRPVATKLSLDNFDAGTADTETLTTTVATRENLLNPVLKTSAAPIKQADSAKASIAEQDAELKISMARAYVDMGYLDAAKEILEEVLAEGTTEQKETVQQMLSML